MPYDVIREVEVPMKQTQMIEVEKPIYIDRVVKKPIKKYINVPYYVEKRVEVPVDVDVEREIVQHRYIDKEVE